ncbi:MAG: tyrosine-type recombinase/integrase [Candidatus Omnitrophica bacterium]|nr:tyrosine-type recombinase/integrase [Candidatus Omnitrophota bacterium]
MLLCGDASGGFCLCKIQVEHGYAIRTIQEFLGHEKLETTMIYAHITQKKFAHITSPLDAVLPNPC